MKKLLLLGLLLGFPSPLFAGSTDGYKTEAYCKYGDSRSSVSLMKKKNSNSRKWGV